MKKCKNDYQKIDDKLTLLTVTKRNGNIENAIIDTWHREKIKAEKYHVKLNGYFKNSKGINLTEIIKGKPPEGMVINHKNGIKADNREENLELVSDSVNKIMRKRKKKDALPNGIFSYTLKNGELRYRVRRLNNNLKGFKTLDEAFQFRLWILVQKGANIETAKAFLGQTSRKEYDKLWKIRALLAA